jgi:hypothetical protein
VILLISDPVQTNGQKPSLRRCLWIRLPSNAPPPRRSLAAAHRTRQGSRISQICGKLGFHVLSSNLLRLDGQFLDKQRGQEAEAAEGRHQVPHCSERISVGKADTVHNMRL